MAEDVQKLLIGCVLIIRLMFENVPQLPEELDFQALTSETSTNTSCLDELNINTERYS